MPTRASGERPTVVERTLSRTDVEEIEYRYAALAPYLS